MQAFCEWLNAERCQSGRSIPELYALSFDAHYRLVTIHPWADGNGRMARLLMNRLQFEVGILPSKIRKERKADYIEALIATRDREDESIFRNFMFEEHIANLGQMIEEYQTSIERAGTPAGRRKEDVRANVRVKITERQQRILDMLRREPSATIDLLAAQLQVNERTIRRDMNVLREQRVGADKTGSWEVAAPPVRE